LVDQYWRHLQQQSLALFSPRRVGKTSILRRMEHLAPKAWRIRLRDLEGLGSVQEFVRSVYEDAVDLLSGSTKALTRAKAFLQRVSGSFEISHVKLTFAGEDWRRFLESLFEDLDEELGVQNEYLVFLWDEFTLFIGDLTLRGMERDAMVLLDTLRALRQRPSRIRMVLTGSIGFHLVMRQLDAKGYRNRPLNDVRTERVPMLAPADAALLAEALLRGIGQEPEADVVEAIITQSEGHPFVIQHLVELLRGKPTPTPTDIESALADLLAPPSELDLGHYATRLTKYYGDREAAAFAILDLLAQEPKGLVANEIFARLPEERSVLLSTIQDLRDDDYILQRNRHFCFALEFVRRHWREDRVL